MYELYGFVCNCCAGEHLLASIGTNATAQYNSTSSIRACRAKLDKTQLKVPTGWDEAAMTSHDVMDTCNNPFIDVESCLHMTSFWGSFATNKVPNQLSFLCSTGQSSPPTYTHCITQITAAKFPLLCSSFDGDLDTSSGVRPRDFGQ